MCKISLKKKNVEQGLKKSSNTNPYILAVGEDADKIISQVIVSGNKVITDNVGKNPLVGLLTLLAAHYTYSWEYNNDVREVLEFIQEKWLKDPLSQRRKTSIAYSNLFKSISCIEDETAEK